MATTPLVVLAGNVVTTWDSFNPNADPFTFYPQGDLPISDVAWNHNGQVLASCSAVSTDERQHNNVVLTAAQTGNPLDSLQHNQQWKRRAGSATSLAFGGKSRYLCVGDDSGAVCLWDLKKKLRVRQFFDPQNAASIQVSLDPTDTFVLNLTSNILRSYKLREGVPAHAWATVENYRFSRYSCSALEPKLSAVGTDDGSLLMYDIANLQSSKPLVSLDKRHNGVITGVAFSITNDKLVASTSDDGSLQFHDKSSGVRIEELARVHDGISSLTLNVDGVSCAVGTPSGEVLIYDLRHVGSSLASLQVPGAVQSLRFSPPPKNKVLKQPSRKAEAMVSSTPQQTLKNTNIGMHNEGQSVSAASEEQPPIQYQGPSGGSTMKDISPVSSKSPHKGNGATSYNYGKEVKSSYTSPFENHAGVDVRIDAIRDVVRDEVEKLQDDLEENLRNLHMDMIQQFHQQSEELNAVLNSQITSLDQLRDENQRLREENDFLKRNRQAS